MVLGIKQITNVNLLYKTGNSVLCGDLNGKEIEKKKKKSGYMYTYDSFILL